MNKNIYLISAIIFSFMSCTCMIYGFDSLYKIVILQDNVPLWVVWWDAILWFSGTMNALAAVLFWSMFTEEKFKSKNIGEGS